MRRPLVTFPLTSNDVGNLFEASNKLTVDSWNERWVENVKHNLTNFHPLKMMHNLIYDLPNKHVALVLGAGWTLHKLKPYVDKLPKSWGIICCDRSLPFVLDCGLKPDLVVTMDGDQREEKTLLSGFSRLPEDVPVMVDIVCCPSVTKQLKNPYWFRSVSDIPTKADELIEEYEKTHNIKIDLVGHGGNVGSGCVIAAKYFMFARHVVLLGMNYSMWEGTRNLDAWDKREISLTEHKFVNVTDIYGRPIRTLANLHNYRLWLELFCHQNDDVEWINANDGGYLGVHSQTENYDHFTYETLPQAIERLGDHGLEEH